MRRSSVRLLAVLLLCAMSAALCACASGHTQESTPAAVPSVSVSSAPSASPAFQVSVPPSSQPPAYPSDFMHGNVPAVHPDEDTSLTYPVNEEELTVSAIKHYTLHGYSIVYDTEHYVCNSFTEGDSYWSCEGNYLSVSLIFGMPMEDVLAGLRLQENIAMEPQPATVGTDQYAAQTLHLTSSAGLYRQFWAVEYAGDILLIEQSFDTFSVNASVYRASQAAMLATLTLLY